MGGARKAKVWEGVLGQSFLQTDNVGATRKHGARARDQKPSPTPPGPTHLIARVTLKSRGPNTHSLSVSQIKQGIANLKSLIQQSRLLETEIAPIIRSTTTASNMPTTAGALDAFTSNSSPVTVTTMFSPSESTSMPKPSRRVFKIGCTLLPSPIDQVSDSHFVSIFSLFCCTDCTRKLLKNVCALCKPARQGLSFELIVCARVPARQHSRCHNPACVSGGGGKLKGIFAGSATRPNVWVCSKAFLRALGAAGDWELVGGDRNSATISCAQPDCTRRFHTEPQLYGHAQTHQTACKEAAQAASAAQVYAAANEG